MQPLRIPIVVKSLAAYRMFQSLLKGLANAGRRESNTRFTIRTNWLGMELNLVSVSSVQDTGPPPVKTPAAVERSALCLQIVSWTCPTTVVEHVFNVLESLGNRHVGNVPHALFPTFVGIVFVVMKHPPELWRRVHPTWKTRVHETRSIRFDRPTIPVPPQVVISQGPSGSNGIPEWVPRRRSVAALGYPG